MHVFIKNGLNACAVKPSLRLLEMGFGTGLNAALTFKQKPLKQSVHYISLEAFPLSRDECEEWIKCNPNENYEELHQAKWNEPVELNKGFKLEKIEADLLQTELPTNLDLVYYDAFGPRVQPELWTLEVFEKLYKAMNIGGVLVTYSAKGSVRRNMIAAGFNVERLPGPPGKREMLRARK